MIVVSRLDALASRIRVEHIRREEALGRDSLDRHPEWELLPAERRKRWRAIAHTAMEVMLEEMVCSSCGCTQDRACSGGCAWAAVSLCTACAGED